MKIKIHHGEKKRGRMLSSEKPDSRYHKFLIVFLIQIGFKTWATEELPKTSPPHTQKSKMSHQSACKKHTFRAKTKDTMSNSNV